MKIRHFVVLLALLVASTAYSTASGTASCAREKQKAEVTSEKGTTIDISKVRLREGTHEVYRDKKSGLIISTVVKDGKLVRYLAKDKNGMEPLPCTPCGGCCYGSGRNQVCFIRYSAACYIMD